MRALTSQHTVRVLSEGPRASLAERVQYLGGPRGLYRGALPSILCGGLRNGCATVAMNGFANPLITRLGLRET